MTIRQHLAALLDRLDRTEQAAQLERAQPGSTGLPREGAPTNQREMGMEQDAVVAGTWRSVLPSCPQCQQTAEVFKGGKNRSESQRFHCRACRLYFTPQPSVRQPDHARKARAMALAEQGMSHRRIASLLGVHHQTVGKWVSPPST
jgi:transposase-like protein